MALSDKTAKNLIQVLLVDDNHCDVIITRKALEQNMLPHNLNVVEDGLEALSYMYHKPPFDDTDKYPKPDLILLDLNMPNIDGHEVLRKIKEHKDFNSIHVAVLSSSKKEEDIYQTFDKGAVTYIHKSIDGSELTNMISIFNEYWTLKTASH